MHTSRCDDLSVSILCPFRLRTERPTLLSHVAITTSCRDVLGGSRNINGCTAHPRYDFFYNQDVLESVGSSPCLSLSPSLTALYRCRARKRHRSQLAVAGTHRMHLNRSKLASTRLCNNHTICIGCEAANLSRSLLLNEQVFIAKAMSARIYVWVTQNLCPACHTCSWRYGKVFVGCPCGRPAAMGAIPSRRLGDKHAG